MGKIKFDFEKVTGPMRPLHGICNAPILGTDDALFHYLGEAGIPYSRLHDTGGRYGGYVFVDIENIFRNFDADVDDPASYDFPFTDWLLAELMKQGVEPFYRLGATIENSYALNAYRIIPPKDPHKWAEICAHIIAHYNEGWASGFHYNIKYWEIWNEPDNSPDMMNNPMWRGTKEQYFELYEVTAKLLKERFPDIKVGGYASCGFYAIDDEELVAAANVDARMQYFIDFAHDFLAWITSDAHRAPIDFFSWHSYADARRNVRFAQYARKILMDVGLDNVESIFNEWNPGIANRGLLWDAALIAEMMCVMHRESDVSLMTYYDGQVNTSYGGMFDPVHERPFKAYYPFKAFNELYKLGQAVELSIQGGHITALAARGAGKRAIMLVNTSKRAEKCVLEGLPDGDMQLKLIDNRHDLTDAGSVSVTDGHAEINMGGYNVALLMA